MGYGCFIVIDDKFNFIIGRYFKKEGGSISDYALFGTVVFYGNQKFAEGILKEVKQKSDKKGWRIFKIDEKK